MVVTVDCRDIINCKVTIVLCNRALDQKYAEARSNLLTNAMKLLQWNTKK